MTSTTTTTHTHVSKAKLKLKPSFTTDDTTISMQYLDFCTLGQITVCECGFLYAYQERQQRKFRIHYYNLFDSISFVYVSICYFSFLAAINVWRGPGKSLPNMSNTKTAYKLEGGMELKVSANENKCWCLRNLFVFLFWNTSIIITLSPLFEPFLEFEEFIHENYFFPFTKTSFIHLLLTPSHLSNW